jgi:hypothetical protein
MVRQDFNSRKVGSISSKYLLQRAGAIALKMVDAGTKGKWDETYRLAQQRNHSLMAARMAVDYEKGRKQFDRTAKTFSKNRIWPSVEQEYVNWIQDLLLRTGHSLPARTVQDLAENIGRQSEGTLEDFVKAKEAHFLGDRPIDVADFLLDPNFRKNVDDLTAWEFEGLKQSVKILEKAGRDERTVNVGGETWDQKKLQEAASKQLATFGYSRANFELQQSKFKALRYMAYGLTNMETLLNRWDHGNPLGVLNQAIVRPLVEAANGKARMLREVAQDLATITRPGKKLLTKLVEAPFADPISTDGQGKWTGFNYGNVLMMLQHAGNDSNWNVLARGYGADPKALWTWLGKNVTREDVVRAQGLGGIFKKLIGHSDKVYERLTGGTVEKIPLGQRSFTLSDGTTMEVPGWYHPLDKDPVRSSMWKIDEDTGERTRNASKSRESAYSDDDFFHGVTANGYTKKRTGAIYPLNLDYNMIPSRIRQMVHDINFREPILNSQKLFANKLFKEDVSKYYGKEYADGLMPYLKHLAGAEGIRSSATAWADAFVGKSVQDIVSTYIGFNPFTMAKHGPTALVMSMNEVGKGAFLKAMMELAKPGGDDIRKFARDNSEEIQRRDRNWQDSLGGQGNELSDKSTTRERIIEWGSKGVAWSDMVSAMPTWWARYQSARDAGEDHGMSVFLADRAVRRAHGSTAETNLPPIARSGGPINRYLTAVYGFFGTAMQRRIELAQQVNDTYKLGREGEIRNASKNVAPMLRNFMTYIVWPTIVEEAVRGMTTEDRRDWPAYLTSAATMGLSSSVLYIRDLAYGLTMGKDPGVGLISSFLHDIKNVATDIYHGTGALDRQHAGKTVEDALTLFGDTTGKMPKTVAHAARFGIDSATGQQQANTPIEFARGVVHGKAELGKR